LVAGFPGRVVHVAVEARLAVHVPALESCGAVAHLAEPVETSALRGRTRRAKTDRADARWLRELLCQGRLPESWAPPEHVPQSRSRAVAEHSGRRAHELGPAEPRDALHHGIAGAPDDPRSLAGRQFLAGLELPVDARERICVALEMIELLEIQLSTIEPDLRAFARRQVGCQALMAQYGMGEISALVTLYELGDVTRRHASRQAVRMPDRQADSHASAPRLIWRELLRNRDESFRANTSAGPEAANTSY
jgi:transposase